jgi:hypothetical protein
MWKAASLKPGAMMHFAIEAENAAEGAEGVSFVSFAERFYERCSDRGPAGIVVFDDHGGRLSEFADQVQSTIEIE